MQSKLVDFKSAEDIEAIEEIVALAMAILAGMELDLFSHLSDGPRTPEEVAEALGVDAWRLGRLMYILVHSGLVEEAGGKFSNSGLADMCLVKGRPGYMGSIHELWSDIWGSLLKTSRSIRSGRAAALHDFSAMSEDDLSALFRGLHAGTTRSGRNLARLLDLGRFGHILDAGGGSGGVAVGVCREIAGMKATIADLPKVAAIAEGFVADEGLGDRIDVKAVDLAVAAPPGSYDIAILRALLQTVGPDTAGDILANVGLAIRKGGEIHVVGRILEDNRTQPTANSIFDLVFLNFYDHGASHTFSQHVEWFEAAGFTEVTMRTGPGSTRIVSGVKR